MVSEAEVETEPEVGGEERSASSAVSRSSVAERVANPGDKSQYRRIVETVYKIVK